MTINLVVPLITSVLVIVGHILAKRDRAIKEQTQIETLEVIRTDVNSNMKAALERITELEKALRQSERRQFHETERESPREPRRTGL